MLEFMASIAKGSKLNPAPPPALCNKAAYPQHPVPVTSSHRSPATFFCWTSLNNYSLKPLWPGQAWSSPLASDWQTPPPLTPPDLLFNKPVLASPLPWQSESAGHPAPSLCLLPGVSTASEQCCWKNTEKQGLSPVLDESQPRNWPAKIIYNPCKQPQYTELPEHKQQSNKTTHYWQKCTQPPRRAEKTKVEQSSWIRNSASF